MTAIIIKDQEKRRGFFEDKFLNLLAKVLLTYLF